MNLNDIIIDTRRQLKKGIKKPGKSTYLLVKKQVLTLPFISFYLNL